MRESQVEAYLMTRVKACGGEVRKVKWIGRVGAPDRIVFMRGVTLMVELKSPTGTLSAAQRREHLRIGQLGGMYVWVLRTFAEVEDFISYAVAHGEGGI